MDYLQYLIYFGAYISAVVLHELLHYATSRLLGYNPTMSIFGLSVSYMVPEDKLHHVRIIAVAPLVEAFVVAVALFAFSTITLTWIMFLLGLVINTSGSDISVSRALGNENWWTKLDSGMRVLCGAAVLYIAAKITEYMYTQTNVYGEQLFYFYLADALLMSAILVAVIGICMAFFLDNNDSTFSLKSLSSGNTPPVETRKN